MELGQRLASVPESPFIGLYDTLLVQPYRRLHVKCYALTMSKCAEVVSVSAFRQHEGESSMKVFVSSTSSLVLPIIGELRASHVRPSGHGGLQHWPCTARAQHKTHIKLRSSFSFSSILDSVSCLASLRSHPILVYTSLTMVGWDKRQCVAERTRVI